MTHDRSAGEVGHVESVVSFGAGDRLVGTWCAPRSDGAGTCERPVFLLFNAGVIPRIGPHRLNVKLARALVREGCASLRFDLSGHGDSRGAADGLRFEERGIADVIAAVDAVELRRPGAPVVVFGVCSGAALGYAAAIRDPRLRGCAMLDPYMYPTLRTHLIRMRARVRADGLDAVIGWLRRRLGTGTAPAREKPAPAAGLGLSRLPKADFAAGLHALLDRGTRLLVVYSGSELYSYNHAGQFDDGFRRFGLAGRVRAEFVPDLDHTVTELSAQRWLVGRLLDWVRHDFAAAPVIAREPVPLAGRRTEALTSK